MTDGDVCVTVHGEGTQPRVVTLELVGQDGDYTQELVVGQRSCIEAALPARVSILDHPTENGERTVAEPGEVEFRLVAVCDVSVHLVDTTGAPFHGAAVLSGTLDGIFTWEGPGPHAVRARCGGSIGAQDMQTRSRVYGRVEGADLQIQLPAASDLPCTELVVVDDGGEPVETLDSRWPQIAPGLLEICSLRQAQWVSVGAVGFVRLRAWVDMARTRTQLVLPRADTIDVVCRDGVEEVPCPVANIDCSLGQHRSLQAGSAWVNAACTAATASTWRCDCPEGAAVWLQYSADRGWRRCVDQGDQRVYCDVPERGARLALVGPAASSLSGWAWFPDEGLAVGSLFNPTLQDLPVGSGSFVAIGRDGWDAGRLTLGPGDDVEVTVAWERWQAVPVSCSDPVSVAWWARGVLIGVVDVPPGGPVPGPALLPGLILEGAVSCAQGDDRVVVVPGLGD
ncbi:MAG: hypothetical protein GXP62_03070 [Oligoflexia bacterium]|nr:hypothetical protein [Oligoflexia bacterium]